MAEEVGVKPTIPELTVRFHVAWILLSKLVFKELFKIIA